MHGNVEEWRQDRQDNKYYGSGVNKNPHDPDHGESRVVRGGSWRDAASGRRAADRDGLVPDYRLDYVGFRIRLRLD
jgi:formylglycine-generating enzyme required for sulfatase activity